MRLRLSIPACLAVVALLAGIALAEPMSWPDGLVLVPHGGPLGPAQRTNTLTAETVHSFVLADNRGATGYTEIVSYDEQGKIAGGCYDDLRAAAEAAQEFVWDPDVVFYNSKFLTHSTPCRACDLRAEAERVERLKDVARRLREVIQRCPR